MNILKSLLKLFVRANPGCDESQIIIFGAGKMGLDLLGKLHKSDLSVAYFAITTRPGKTMK